jgi:hypothetical protein
MEGIFLKMQETKLRASALEKTPADEFRHEADRTRLLGWAVTLTGAALMVGGGMIAILSAF